MRTIHFFAGLMLLAVIAAACNPFAAPTTIPLPSAIPPRTAPPTFAPPTATLPPSATPTPPLLPPATSAEQQPKRISFAAGSTTAAVQGNLPASGLERYILRALAGQTMTIKVSSSQANMLFSVNGADGQVLKSSGAGTASWSGILPATQDYIITISSETGVAANYALQVTIPPLATEVREPTPKRISFAPGATSATVQGVLARNGMERWVIRVFAGQTLMLNAAPTNGNVMLIVFGADGTVLQTDHVRMPNFSGSVPSTQDYIVDVRAWGDTAPAYALQVSIPPLPTPDPRLQPKRIAFAPGGTTAILQGSIAANAADRYVLRVLAGQIMSAIAWTSQGRVTLMIYGADGTMLVPDQAQATSASGNLPTAQDYFIQVNAQANAAAAYTLQVTIPPLDLPSQRIAFPPGGITTTLQGSLAPNAMDRYVLRASAGQTLTLKVTSPQNQAVVMAWDADGLMLIPDRADATTWIGRLPATQDYYINVWSSSTTNLGYVLQVTIPAR